MENDFNTTDRDNKHRASPEHPEGQGVKIESRGGQGGGDTPGHLDPAQVVDQRLHVREDALGVGLVPHNHHVLHFQKRHAVGVRPGTETEREGVRKRRPFTTGTHSSHELIIVFN